MSRSERKIIIFELTKTEEGVNLRLIMDSPNYDVLFDPKLTATHWGYLVESLWQNLGLEVEVDLLRRLYPKQYLEINFTEIFILFLRARMRDVS